MVLGGGTGLLARLGRSAVILWSPVGDSPVLPTAAEEVRAGRKVPLKLPEEGEEEHLVSGALAHQQRAGTEVGLSGPVSLRGMGLASEERRAATVAQQVVIPFTGARAAEVLMPHRREKLAGQAYSGLGLEAAVAVPTTKPVAPGELLIRSPLEAEELAAPRIIPASLARLALRVAEAEEAEEGLLIPVASVGHLEAVGEEEELPITVRLETAQRVVVVRCASFLYEV